MTKVTGFLGNYAQYELNFTFSKGDMVDFNP